MCLGSIFSRALAVFPSLMSSFFSQAPHLLPRLPSETIKSETVWTLASLSSSPCPLLSQTFWLQQALSRLDIKAVLPDFLSAGGRASASSQTLRINPETVGIPAARGRGRARRGHAAHRGALLTSLLWGGPLVHSQQREALLPGRQPPGRLLARSVSRSAKRSLTPAV